MAHPTVTSTAPRTRRLVWAARRIPKPIPPGQAIEIDGPRQWIHIGSAATIYTYHAQTGGLVFVSDAYAVDLWTRLRADRRRADLLMLGKSGGDYVLYISQDGGRTATEVLSVTTVNALIERDSERSKSVVLLQDGSGNITYRRSDDLSAWTTAAACQLIAEDGSASDLVATLLDSSQDPRRAAINLLCEFPDGSHATLESKDIGAKWVRRADV